MPSGFPSPNLSRPMHQYSPVQSSVPVEKSQAILGIRRREPSLSPQPPISSNARGRHKASYRLQNLWLWEIAAVIFSLVCIAAVVIVLIYEDGKELQGWRLRIAPNAVISFLATVAKASFLVAITEIISQLKWLHFQSHPQQLSDLNLFDQASRGPWGAFKLSVFKHKNTLLASWAALVMLGALLVDPALQLVFSFPTHLAPTSAVIPIFRSAQTYDPKYAAIASFNANNGHGTGAQGIHGNSAFVSPDMQAAIIDAFHPSPLAPQMSCTANQCRWNRTITLGVCGSCEDMTLQIQKNCSIDPSYTEPLTSCQYDFGNGIALGSWNVSAADASPLGNRGPDWTMWNSTALDLSPSFVNIPAEGGVTADEEALLTIFGAVKFGNPVDSVVPPAQALMCGFNMCVKNYDDIVQTNGTPTVTVTEGPTLNTSVSQQYCTSGNGSVISDCFADENARFYQHLLPSSTSQNMTNASFTINTAEFTNLGAFLQEMFTGSWTSTGVIGRNQFDGSNGGITPMILQLLAQSLDVNNTMKAVADAITEVIRISPNSTSAIGSAFVQTTFIHVQWGWLALPISLMLMTVVLLAIVIVQSHVKKAVVWKSSSLAMLFHRTEGWDIPPGSVSDRHELEEMARQMRGQLRDDLAYPSICKS